MMSNLSYQLIIVLTFFGALHTASAQTLLINNVNIVDVQREDILPMRNILIEDGRIKGIYLTEERNYPAETKVFEATGKYVIPGLWDMHEHWYDTEYLPLYIASGVTGLREMSGADINYEWRRDENQPDFIGPKSIISSRVLDGPTSPIPGITKVETEEQAREEVRKYFVLGADFIKIYNDLSREVYFAIADESSKLGIPFAGHIPMGVTALEAAAAGQRSIEHNAMITIATSDTYPNIAHEYGSNRSDDQELEFQRRIHEGYGGERTTLTYERLASSDIWLTPTLTVMRYVTFVVSQFELLKDFWRYLPHEYASGRQQYAEYIRENRTNEQHLFEQRQFAHHKLIVGDMHKAGVKLLAGTDGGFYCFPGCMIQDELELFVEAGLSPIEALKTATLNAAEAAGKSVDFGSVEEGKIADLVLLDSNPMIEIENTRKIHAVVLNGVLHDREALDAMREEVKNLPANFSGMRP